MKVATAASSMAVPNSSFNRNEKAATNDVRQHKRQVYNANEMNQKQISRKCPRCNDESHALQKCPQFLSDTIENRWNVATAKKLCFSCLRTGHQTANCTIRRACGVGGCTEPHNTLLHRSKTTIPAPTNFCGNSKDVLLRVMPVNLTGPNGTVKTYALLDDGSTVTMLDKSVATSIGLSGPQKSLCLQWTNNMMQTEQDSQVVSCQIAGIHENAKTFTLKNVQTISSLDLPSQSVDVEAMKTKWPHLADIPVESLNLVKPSLIIGEDNILLTIAR